MPSHRTAASVSSNSNNFRATSYGIGGGSTGARSSSINCINDRLLSSQRGGKRGGEGAAVSEGLEGRSNSHLSRGQQQQQQQDSLNLSQSQRSRIGGSGTTVGTSFSSQNLRRAMQPRPPLTSVSGRGRGTDSNGRPAPNVSRPGSNGSRRLTQQQQQQQPMKKKNQRSHQQLLSQKYDNRPSSAARARPAKSNGGRPASTISGRPGSNGSRQSMMQQQQQQRQQQRQKSLHSQSSSFSRSRRVVNKSSSSHCQWRPTYGRDQQPTSKQQQQQSRSNNNNSHNNSHKEDGGGGGSAVISSQQENHSLLSQGSHIPPLGRGGSGNNKRDMMLGQGQLQSTPRPLNNLRNDNSTSWRQTPSCHTTPMRTAIGSVGTGSNVRVITRVRPLTPGEKIRNETIAVNCNEDDRTISVDGQQFTFDRVFDESASQIQLYNEVEPLLGSLFNGYNITILAYGQTGTGKSYTMGSEARGEGLIVNANGGVKINEGEGLIPRFISDLFASLSRRKEEQSISLIDFTVSASFLEVYGDGLYDLLQKDSKQVFLQAGIVKGLKSIPIRNAFEAMNVLNTGVMKRTTGATSMNCTSSRSHAVFTLNLQQTTRSAEGVDVTTKSTFTFVDLAGSERMDKAGVVDTTCREGIDINKGLFFLGQMIDYLAIEKLATGEKVRVPYRNSKLTFLLREALGGNSRTLFIACVSPSESNAIENLSTLKYATRAKIIQNAPVRNVDATAEKMQRLCTLTKILERELIKQKFDNKSVSEIGTIDEGLLKREDVVAYMQQIDEKVAELSGGLTMNPSASASSGDLRREDQPLEEMSVERLMELHDKLGEVVSHLRSLLALSQRRKKV